eukprot:2293449-Rhodomonas_salina.1
MAHGICQTRTPRRIARLNPEGGERLSNLSGRPLHELHVAQRAVGVDGVVLRVAPAETHASAPCVRELECEREFE